MSNKKNYDKDFKCKVALEAYKGDLSILELCKKYNIPKTNIHDWLSKLKNEASTLFLSSNDEKRKFKAYEKEIYSLQEIIAEISIENSYLKKKLKK